MDRYYAFEIDPHGRTFPRTSGELVVFDNSTARRDWVFRDTDNRRYVDVSAGCLLVSPGSLHDPEYLHGWDLNDALAVYDGVSV